VAVGHAHQDLIPPPAARRRSRKVMFPWAGDNSVAAPRHRHIDLVCARPERPGRGLGRRDL